MLRTGLLTIVMIAAVSIPSASPGGELLRGLHRLIYPSSAPPSWSGNPQPSRLRQMAYPPPGPWRYPEYANPGCAPWYGYGFGVPTYSWGYFGVKYRGQAWCHKGYYGDFYQYGYRQGY